MDDAKILSAIAERSAHFENAYCAGDAAALVEGYFADDRFAPRACPPGGSPPVVGRAALNKMFGEMFTAMPSIRLETIDVTASDTVAFELGRAHLTALDGTRTTGRYTVCWISTDEGWRAKIDFFADDGWSD